jgi:hypothetical protein
MPVKRLAFALLLIASTARAQDAQKEACANAYDTSQVLRDEGKLLLAREQLAVCERACPPKLAVDCTKWRTEVEARLASIPPGAPVDVKPVVTGTAPTTAFTSLQVGGISLLSAGGLGLAVAAALTIRGHVQRGALFDCKPNCPQSDVDAVATLWTGAGATAAISAAAFGAGLAMFLIRPKTETVSLTVDGLAVSF